MHLRHPLSGRRLRPAGFTLIEMLVSIGIILVMVGIALPIMNTMNNWSTVDAGVNTVGVAVQATRAYVDRERTGNSDPFVHPDDERPGTPFAGIAIIFAPSGEIRITRPNPSAATNAAGTDLLAMHTPVARWGFEDIPNRDYIEVPSNVRIQGLIRVGNSNTQVRTHGQPGAPGTGLLLIDPPFAIRFDQFGELITGRGDWQAATADAEDGSLVYYDSNLNGTYEIDRDYDYGSYLYATYRETYTTQWDADLLKHAFPVEEIDTVIGVRVIDPNLYDFANPATADPNSYRDIFFSRYTGAPLRNQ